MHCLIVVLLIVIVVLVRPSSIIHRPSTIVSIRRPSFAIRHRVSPHLQRLLLDIAVTTRLKG